MQGTKMFGLKVDKVVDLKEIKIREHSQREYIQEDFSYHVEFVFSEKNC